MSALDFAMQMFPCWAFGIIMLTSVYLSSYRDILTVNVREVLKWAAFMLLITTCRLISCRIFSTEQELADLSASIAWLPTWSTLLVPWEDLSHTIPLIVMGRMMPDTLECRSLRILCMFFLMIDFGMGHLYQGLLAAVLLSLYIPITLWAGRKVGFGTVMCCHVIYDLMTVILIKYLI